MRMRLLSEAREQVQRSDDIRVGRAVAPELEELTIREVPVFYTNFYCLNYHRNTSFYISQ